MDGHRRATLAALVLLLGTAACGSSDGGDDAPLTSTQQTAAYRAVWQRDWLVVNRVSAPWNPTGSEPGACDSGGDQKACYETDSAVRLALNNLLGDLKSNTVPPGYEAANKAMVAAIDLEILGIENRMLGITSKSEKAFSTGLAQLKDAAGKLIAAYELFPERDRPTPALFGEGRRAS